MSHRDYHHYGDYHYPRCREHHPRIGIGLFFIVLGLSLLIATNDLLNLEASAAILPGKQQ